MKKNHKGGYMSKLVCCNYLFIFGAFFSFLSVVFLLGFQYLCGSWMGLVLAFWVTVVCATLHFDGMLGVLYCWLSTLRNEMR